jgi:hypothetical protein
MEEEDQLYNYWVGSDNARGRSDGYNCRGAVVD